MSDSRILVVEDRESLRLMLDRALSGEGYLVETSPNAEAAIETIQRSDFDLVLTDLKLPGQSGLEVLKASRQHDRSVPVVVLTADTAYVHAGEAWCDMRTTQLSGPVTDPVLVLNAR